MRRDKPISRERAQRVEHPGRKVGKPHGTWVTDLAELCKTVILCDCCSHKFDRKKYRYYKQREFPFVLGKCDACKNFGRAQLFIHESEVKKCWAAREPREKYFNF